MNQEVTVGRFLKGGLEAFYERRRQILDVADGVGQDAFETGTGVDTAAEPARPAADRLSTVPAC